MADSVPNTEGVVEAFQKVDELKVLGDLIQVRLSALCANAPKASISLDAEYKVLRDEIIHLLNRIFVLLAAMVTGSAVAINSALSLIGSSPLRALALVLGLCVALAAAIVLTYKMYEHIDKIRFYLQVYHEEAASGWHSRLPGFNKYRREITAKWFTKRFYSFGQLEAITNLYRVLVLGAAGMLSLFPPLYFAPFLGAHHIDPRQAIVVTWLALAILFLVALWRLWRMYETGRDSMESLWLSYKQEQEKMQDRPIPPEKG